MESCLYTGRLAHRRLRPVEHAFEARLTLAYLDLAELDRVFAGRWLWSTSRPALTRFRREDHFGEPDRGLDACVRDLVAERTGRRPEGPIRLLTQLRRAGFVFNPASFYYCFDAAGEQLRALVVEVTNTPWNERHCYVLPAQPGEEVARVLRARHAKDFHVSPFMAMAMDYEWSIGVPGERLSLAVRNLEHGHAPLFDASLSLERHEIEGPGLARALARDPLGPWRAFAAIYWQALRLRWKNVPFHPHPRGESPAPEMIP